ncbi:hypothetical protein Q5Y75_16140 [Ruegeria sp. 2205SS24-7]|uniref:calcium-binding protein n=1 Tax=Ruegeria discodermiae TaxID=3064389 RepID=UPI0027417471|nr:hypothetical protein [Ruegeria sp. 2205SS24-7]MDP5218760.1 hypothetical protein [Ruegeria sp. 2205SS24-7]
MALRRFTQRLGETSNAIEMLYAGQTRKGDDNDVDISDILIWNIDGGSVAEASATTGGLPDIMVRDDDDDSAPTDDSDDLPDMIIWDIDGGNLVDHRNSDNADQFVFEKNDDEVLPDQNQEIVGTIGNDLLVGTDASELVRGYQGDDILSGMGGNDEILAGTGNDTIFGGEGNDRMYGMAGDDVVYGGSGDDLLRAGIGNDELAGGDGADQFAFLGNISGLLGLATIKDFEIGLDSFIFNEAFLNVAPGETLHQNVIALEGNGGTELWADVADIGLTQIAFVEDLTMQQLQIEFDSSLLL